MQTRRQKNDSMPFRAITLAVILILSFYSCKSKAPLVKQPEAAADQANIVTALGPPERLKNVQYCPEANRVECWQKKAIKDLVLEADRMFFFLRYYKGPEAKLMQTFQAYSIACDRGADIGCKGTLKTIDEFGIGFLTWGLIRNSSEETQTFLAAQGQKRCTQKITHGVCHQTFKNWNKNGCFINCAIEYSYENAKQTAKP